MTPATRSQRVKQLLARAKEKRRPLGLNLLLDSAPIVEIAGRAGFSWLRLNTQHTLIQGAPRIAELLRAAELFGLPSIVKVNDQDPLLIRDALDAGAAGVCVPSVETKEELREVIAAVRFPPHGKREFCQSPRAAFYQTNPHFGRLGDTMEHIRFTNEDALIIPIIESEKAIEHLDEMLSVPECPIFMTGSDLPMSLGLDISDPEDQKYEAQVTLALARKVHGAGKLISLSLQGPSQKKTRQEAREANEIFDNDLPFVADTGLLAYSMLEALAVAEPAQPSEEPRR